MNRIIYPPVSNALSGLMQGFSISHPSSTETENEAFSEKVLHILSDKANLKSKLNALDKCFDQHMEYEDLRELCADLMVLNEWVSGEEEDLEDESLLEERGTELMHMMTYLDECRELGQDPGIKDFLSLYEDEPDSEDMDYFRLLFECSEAIAHGPEALAAAFKERNMSEVAPEILPIAFFLTGIKDQERLLRSMHPFMTEESFQIPFLCAMLSFWNGQINQVNQQSE